jgi:hypothetical protein
MAAAGAARAGEGLAQPARARRATPGHRRLSAGLVFVCVTVA